MLAIIGSLILATISFLLGKIFSESEKILAEKRSAYIDFLNVLPPTNDAYLNNSEEDFIQMMRPSEEMSPRLLFYADTNVVFAWKALIEAYGSAQSNLNPSSPALAAEYKALARAQNDLVLEMRRDAFRWSIFNYSGKSRLPTLQRERLDNH
ncbi:hypothetical protein [Litoreibacter albidus]|uniref:Uncharacterized protein n=1 Tax=Litoreibacter albidus TaxID=670155 RepID=A0A1H2ZP12_9RHOB|nr:hypothetical protein [Litoreibacter albidus]SDX19105.1 hypothetical protein SAMN04488001_2662 [Litoreibacter albidus]